MGERWRLFVAIDLGDAARRALTATQAALRRHALPVRWIDPAGAHLTLKFLGDTPAAQVAPLASALRAVAARHRPALLHLGAPGAFPSTRRPRVLWLGLTGDLARLAALHAGVEAALVACGFPREDRPFRPHLTLGRVREGAEVVGLDVAFAALPAGTAAPLPVAAMKLMRSELGRGGARYTTLAEVRLGG